MAAVSGVGSLLLDPDGALNIWRYVARGVGDQDGLIIGGAGVVVFMVIQFFMRKAR